MEADRRLLGDQHCLLCRPKVLGCRGGSQEALRSCRCLWGPGDEWVRRQLSGLIPKDQGKRGMTDDIDSRRRLTYLYRC